MSKLETGVVDIGAQHYATQLGIYDEMVATDNKVLPYWEHFMGMLETMGSEKLESRRREAQRLLRENGVTYNIYSDGQNIARPWLLDPLPLLISSEEWQIIEAGLKQRATLLNLILQDIYGNQTLLKKGLLPPELIFGHEGFLRPCVDALHNIDQQLIIYAANLARDPKGRMWVLDDRTQAPSGMGYALENRTVMTRVLTDIFRETQVHRLSGFFKALCKGLADISPQNKDNPRIVVLTPGPLNETYFEHAYLAASLGFTLVQGGDLTVRDGRLWLKSLSGLQAIDVILRRVDDTFCDPLEMNSLSHLGVAGLMEVVRRGHVVIANPLGSSVLENPGLLAFLPRLSRYFLNEELKLPSVATWWCGQGRERDFVLRNLDNLVIKPINRSFGNHAVFTGALSNSDKDSLRRRILDKPHLYIGQEKVGFSTLPSFVDKHFEPRHAVLRAFLVASDKGYTVMPGGLTRISKDKDDVVVSNQAGGISKDTWVLSSKPENSVNLWMKPNRNQRVDAVFEPLTSRAADNLFWVGRHIERIESSTRLLRTILRKLDETFEANDPVNTACLSILLPALTQVTGTYPGFLKGDTHLLLAPEPELLALTKNAIRKGSLSDNIQAFAQAAFNIRDLWSQDTWRCVDTIHRRWQQKVVNSDITIEQLQTQLDELITRLVAFTGLTSESMTREAAWLMLDSGRRLERAVNLIALLRSTLAFEHEESLQNLVLEAVLVSTDSLTIYQRRYRSYMQLPMVLELLLFDQNHPRSLAYQLQHLSSHIDDLPSDYSKGFFSEEKRIILKAFTDLRLSTVPTLTQVDKDGLYQALDELFSDLSKQLWRLAEVIAEAYFSHSKTSHLMLLNTVEEDL